jgi:hypothetical protein
MGNFFGIPSVLYSSIVWVPDNTIYKIPAMNVRTDTITVHGFSGGSYYAHLFHVVNSATIKGAGLKCGGPWGFGYKGSGKDDDFVNDKLAKVIEKAKDFSDKGLIDNVSNLNGAPVKVIAALKDTA